MAFLEGRLPRRPLVVGVEPDPPVAVSGVKLTHCVETRKSEIETIQGIHILGSSISGWSDHR